MVVEVEVFPFFKNSHFRTILVARSLPCGVGHVGQRSNWAFRAQHESNRYNRENADRFPPLKGGALYSPEINKSVVEHYQVTPRVRWKRSGIIRIETRRIWHWYATK